MIPNFHLNSLLSMLPRLQTRCLLTKRVTLKLFLIKPSVSDLMVLKTTYWNCIYRSACINVCLCSGGRLRVLVFGSGNGVDTMLLLRGRGFPPHCCWLVCPSLRLVAPSTLMNLYIFLISLWTDVMDVQMVVTCEPVT